MNANRVILNGVPILDLTNDTSLEEDVRITKTFHKASGEKVAGSQMPPTYEVREVTPSKETQIVKPITADFLSSVTVLPIPQNYVDDTLIDGINTLIGRGV
jgi:hypothetical protein